MEQDRTNYDLSQYSDEDLQATIDHIIDSKANLQNLYEMCMRERLKRLSNASLDPWTIRDIYTDNHVRGEE